jgi:TetR/AcrR family transcriptional regulator
VTTSPRPHQASAETYQDADERTRQRILRAAAVVFDRKGYAAAPVREIVELAGVTKPALYYHFGSKSGLLLAVLDEAARRFAEALDGAVARPGTTRERLIALGEDLHSLLQEHTPIVRVAHALAFGPAESAPPFDFTTFDRSLVGALQRIVEDGLAAGEVPPARPEDVALAVTGVIGACAARQVRPGLEPVGLDGLHRILGLLFDGVLNTAARSPQSGDRLA